MKRVDDKDSRSRPGMASGGADDRPLRDRLWGGPPAGVLSEDSDEQQLQNVRQTATEENQRHLERVPIDDMHESDLLQQRRSREDERLLHQQVSASLFPDSRWWEDSNSSYNSERQLKQIATLDSERHRSRKREDEIRQELEFRSQLFDARRSVLCGAEAVGGRRPGAEYGHHLLSGAGASFPATLPGQSSGGIMGTLSDHHAKGDSQQLCLAVGASDDEEIRRGEVRITSLRRLVLEEEQNLLLLRERRRRRLLRATFESHQSSRFLLPDRLRASDASLEDLAVASRRSVELDGELRVSRLLMGDRMQPFEEIGGREDSLGRSATSCHDGLSRQVRPDKLKLQAQRFDEEKTSKTATGSDQTTPGSASSTIARSSLKKFHEPFLLSKLSPYSPHDATADPPSKGISLALPTDNGLVSNYQSLIRKSLEFFEAQEEDVAWSMQGRKNKIVLKQIGVRCRFCAHLPARQKGRGSVYFPGKLIGVYQAAQNMTFTHLLESCKVIPADVRERIGEARKNQRTHDNRGGVKKYWIESCKSMGLKERQAQSGLFL